MGNIKLGDLLVEGKDFNAKSKFSKVKQNIEKSREQYKSAVDDNLDFLRNQLKNKRIRIVSGQLPRKGGYVEGVVKDLYWETIHYNRIQFEFVPGTIPDESRGHVRNGWTVSLSDPNVEIEIL